MKHGLKFRALSRDPSHREAMLRNLVTSVLQHQQIKTTLAKAKEAAPLVEKVITYGKRGDITGFKQAQASVLDNAVLPKVFGEYASRYATRVGGYTRIHKFGNRPGDNAPMAILELVDNPRDIKVEMTARAVGWEMLEAKLRTQTPGNILSTGVDPNETMHAIEKDVKLDYKDEGGVLKEKTRWNLQKTTRFQPSTLAVIGEKAQDYMNDLIAQPLQMNKMLDKAFQTREDRRRVAREKEEGNNATRESEGRLRPQSRPDPTAEKHYDPASATSSSGRNASARRAMGVTKVITARRPGAAAPGEWRGPIKRAQGALGKPIIPRYDKPANQLAPQAYTFENTLGPIEKS